MNRLLQAALCALALFFVSPFASAFAPQSQETLDLVETWRQASAAFAEAGEGADPTELNEARDAALEAIKAEEANATGAAADALAELRLEVNPSAESAEDVARQIETYIADGKQWAIDNGPGLVFKLILIVIIYLVFKVIAGIVGRVTKKALSTPKIKASDLLKEFLVGVAQKAVMAVGLLVILSQLGVQIGPLLAGLGVGGFVLGFALQDTLSNFAAGLMILFYRPYDVGDVVNAGGVMGSVDEMSLVSTTIKTPDNQRLIVPNSAIWGGVITNVTAADTRRVDLVFGIGYDDDMAHAERVLAEIVAAHPLTLDDPAVTIKVHELADSSVNFICRPWVKTSDYWAVYWDLTRTVKERFDAEGISIPYPQRDVHVHSVEAEG